MVDGPRHSIGYGHGGFVVGAKPKPEGIMFGLVVGILGLDG
jgi:hypothetical protein